MLTWLVLSSFVALGPDPVDSNDGAHRYALVIGANHGNAGDSLLHYAEEDAGEVSDVLQQMGHFRSADVINLNSPTARDVRDAFATMRRRIQRERTADGSLLFVYYSGHADAAAMHLAGSLMGWSEMIALTNQSQADLRLLIVDACRSGELTQGKGAFLERPFDLPRESQELPRGIAIVTSASAGESAQESATLRASFFTHHFVAGLRGAADLNADGKVTLSEAFAYSSEQAAGDTAQTMIGIQHATYHFHLTGRLELGLTDPGVDRHLTALRIDAPGNYVFRNGPASGPVVLQTQVKTGVRRMIWLPPGHYTVQRRVPDGVSQGPLELRGRTTARLDVAQLERQEYAVVSAKGDVETTVPDEKAPNLQLAVVATGGGAALGSFSMPIGPGLVGSLPVELGGTHWAVDFQLTSMHADSHNPNLNVSEWDTALAAGMRGIFLNFEHLDVSAGAHVGALIFAQSYSGTGDMAARSQVAPLAEGVLRLDVKLPAGWFITCQGLARAAWIDTQKDTGGTARTWTLQPLAALGVGVTW